MKITAKLSILALAVAAASSSLPARAGTSTNTAGPVQNGQSDGGIGTPALNNPAVTISFSGQTALRNFNTSPGILLLQPGTSITLHDGTNGAPVVYTANNSGSSNVLLGSRNFLNPDNLGSGTVIGGVATTQVQSAIRLEWQEKGSLDGFYDLISDQIGYVQNPSDTVNNGAISILATRGPNLASPIWINGTTYTASSASTTAPGSVQTSNGLLLTTGSGLAYYNTYDPTVYNLATGANLKGGTNRVQFAVGEYKTENFAFGAATDATVFAKPGQAGFGQGNPALTPSSLISGLGVANSRQQFQPTSIANLSSDKVDPQSTTGARYDSTGSSGAEPAGPWATAGVDNIDSKQIAATAVLVAANPGTGLKRLNATDIQWIQTAGRLQNGANFNNVSRVANTGQRNVLAINTGVDPTWAVGENDGGDTSTTAQANAQTDIGPAFRVSGKTSGTFARNAIAQSRLGVGALSLAETNAPNSNAPIRALDIDFTDAVDPTVGGVVDHSQFIGLSNSDPTQNFNNFVNGTYKAILISHYNTIKAPNAAYANATPAQWAALTSDQTGIKGDPTGDVAAFINNIAGSVQTFGNGNPSNSVSDPADALIANGYLPPGLLNFKRVADGDPLTPNPLDQSQLDLQTYVKNNYPSVFGVTAVYGQNSATVGAAAGANAPIYGALNVNAYSPTLSKFNGQIPITAKDASGAILPNGIDGPKGNYLFGNFNQDGRRDFASVQEAVSAALALHDVDGAANSAFTADGGVANSTVVTPLSGTFGSHPWATTANTKGDLIVLGDFNSDGKFDGYDLSLLARGVSLADSTSSDHLTVDATHTFADQVRNPTAVLRKNAALDWVRDHTKYDPADSAALQADKLFLRKSALSATARLTDANANPALNYANAFNKFDINQDGAETLTDARIVAKFLNKSYTSLTDQLTATISTTGTESSAGAQQSISLTDVKLIDGPAGKVYGPGNVITANTDAGLITGADLGLITTDLVAQNKLVIGDWGLTGGPIAWIDAYIAEDRSFLHPELIHTWLDGDTNGDGVIDGTDYALLDASFASHGGLADGLIQQHTAEFGSAYTVAFSQAVPEPASLLLLGIGAVGLLGRRRIGTLPCPSGG